MALLIVGAALVLEGSALALPGDARFRLRERRSPCSDVSSSPDDRAIDVLIQPDGKIVAIGFGQGRLEELVGARYREDGTLDPTFGDGGKVAIDIEPSGALPSSAALQPDGKIVVAASTNLGDLSSPAFILAERSTRASTGTASSEPPSAARSARASTEPQGSLSSRTGKSPSSVVRHSVHRPVGDRLCRGAFDASGALDSSFDGDGLLTARVGPNATASDVAIDPQGRIVVVGSRASSASTADLPSRYTTAPASTLEVQSCNLAVGQATAVAAQTDGKLVVAGELDNELVVVRLLGTAAIDPGFGGNGSAIASFASGVAASALDVVVQENEQIVAGGAIRPPVRRTSRSRGSRLPGRWTCPSGAMER